MTRGRVVYSSVSEEYTRGSPAYRVHVRYSYLVDGERYESAQVTPIEEHRRFSFAEDANALANGAWAAPPCDPAWLLERDDEHPAGAEVDVYYCPWKPSLAALDVGLDEGFAGVCTLSAGTGFIGLVSLRIWRRSGKPGGA